MIGFHPDSLREIGGPWMRHAREWLLALGVAVAFHSLAVPQGTTPGEMCETKQPEDQCGWGLQSALGCATCPTLTGLAYCSEKTPCSFPPPIGPLKEYRRWKLGHCVATPVPGARCTMVTLKCLEERSCVLQSARGPCAFTPWGLPVFDSGCDRTAVTTPGGKKFDVIENLDPELI